MSGTISSKALLVGKNLGTKTHIMLSFGRNFRHLNLKNVCRLAAILLFGQNFWYQKTNEISKFTGRPKFQNQKNQLLELLD
jgi:hypothetical protein